MQAALRAGGQELARGVSTGLIVWASSAPPSCVCSCPEVPRAPDCICQGERRRAPVAGGPPYLLLAVWLASLVAAYFAGRASRPGGAPGGDASPRGPALGGAEGAALARRPDVATLAAEVELREAARAQLALVHRRRLRIQAPAAAEAREA